MSPLSTSLETKNRLKGHLFANHVTPQEICFFCNVKTTRSLLGSYFGRGTFFFHSGRGDPFFQFRSTLAAWGWCAGPWSENFQRGRFRSKHIWHALPFGMMDDGWFNTKNAFFSGEMFSEFYLHLSGAILSEKRLLSWRMWWCGSQAYLTVST